ncbi:bifunctional preprotein translocase subunit SecD/SecF [Flammeovirgaceae bacterium 311]|nr:bifunctional preprotein translocase subunit SecD/SecF [Flammeovirgaceae bacterium 311]
MNNKGLVVVLTVVVTLLCLYYLSFTFVSRQVQQKATAHATLPDGSISYSKKQSYLDSVWHEPVYNFLGMEYTYQEVKQTELNLGLDLQGGMNVTLEISPVEVIKGLASNPNDPTLQKAINYARERQRESQASFVELFREGWQQSAAGRPLRDAFFTAANRNVITSQTSDDAVVNFLNEKVENAISTSFEILRTRVDRFGTSQPNIQRLQGSGRILVELPGVDNPERVRKLLQGTAKLEFLEVVEIQEYYQTLAAINSLIVEENRANASTTAANRQTPQPAVTSTDTSATVSGDDDLASQLATADTTAAADSLGMQMSPLFSLNRSQASLLYSVRDTAQINRILNRPDVKNLMPSNLSFVWDVKGFRPEGGGDPMLSLYAVQRERGGRAPLTGEVIERARQDFNERGQPEVVMVMNSDGARTWKRITANNIGQRIAIVLDNYVYSAPVVQSEIPGGVSSISVGGDRNDPTAAIQEAQDLANILEAGALPAPARIVEEAIVGPTLGEMARNQGILSIVAGLGLVVIFIVAYYSKGGLVANIALLFNIFFIFGILANLGAALTLPGIAGIVLTIGMSIDANVLIFERIREELRSGLSLKAAINKGYQKAYSSIIDANVTTLLVAIVLYVMGQGPVKGFAITLIIGILCSLFSAVLITRVIIDWMTAKGDASKMSFDTPLSRNLFKGGDINFMGMRKKAYVFSGVVIAAGLLALVLNNGLNMGVDFTGGRTYVVSFDEPVSPTQLKLDLADNFGGAGTEVKTYGANNVLKVTTSYLIDVEEEESDNQVQAALVQGVEEATGKRYVQDGASVSQGQFSIVSSSKVGATIADDIKEASWEAGLFSLIIMFLYILIRFRGWQFSTGALLALVHDVAITLGAFAIAGALGMTYEVDQVFVAAILTVIGYSINDTVVVFDRIREEVGNRYNKSTLLNTFNSAINSTLNRTLMTSVTTLVVVLILFLFGGEVLRGFSFALLVGILVGTYSSIFVASPIAADLLARSNDEAEVAKPATPVRQKA